MPFSYLIHLNDTSYNYNRINIRSSINNYPYRLHTENNDMQERCTSDVQHPLEEMDTVSALL